MISTTILPNDSIDCVMKSEDGKETIQVKCSYTFKKTKKGKFGLLTFDDSIDIEKQYDCAFSMIENTMPDGIYRCAIANKAGSKNFDIIEEAAKKAGFVLEKGLYVKDIKD